MSSNNPNSLYFAQEQHALMRTASMGGNSGTSNTPLSPSTSALGPLAALNSHHNSATFATSPVTTSQPLSSPTPQQQQQQPPYISQFNPIATGVGQYCSQAGYRLALTGGTPVEAQYGDTQIDPVPLLSFQFSKFITIPQRQYIYNLFRYHYSITDVYSVEQRERQFEFIFHPQHIPLSSSQRQQQSSIPSSNVGGVYTSPSTHSQTSNLTISQSSSQNTPNPSNTASPVSPGASTVNDSAIPCFPMYYSQQISQQSAEITYDYLDQQQIHVLQQQQTHQQTWRQAAVSFQPSSTFNTSTSTGQGNIPLPSPQQTAPLNYNIFKSNWVHKHTQAMPHVVILTTCINYSNMNQVTPIMNELISLYNAVSMSTREYKILVLIIVTSSQVDVNNISTDFQQLSKTLNLDRKQLTWLRASHLPVFQKSTYTNDPSGSGSNSGINISPTAQLLTPSPASLEYKSALDTPSYQRFRDIFSTLTSQVLSVKTKETYKQLSKSNLSLPYKIRYSIKLIYYYWAQRQYDSAIKHCRHALGYLVELVQLNSALSTNPQHSQTQSSYDQSTFISSSTIYTNQFAAASGLVDPYYLTTPFSSIPSIHNLAESFFSQSVTGDSALLPIQFSASVPPTLAQSYAAIEIRSVALFVSQILWKLTLFHHADPFLVAQQFNMLIYHFSALTGPVELSYLYFGWFSTVYANFATSLQNFLSLSQKLGIIKHYHQIIADQRQSLTAGTSPFPTQTTTKRAAISPPTPILQSSPVQASDFVTTTLESLLDDDESDSNSIGSKSQNLAKSGGLELSTSGETPIQRPVTARLGSASSVGSNRTNKIASPLVPPEHSLPTPFDISTTLYSPVHTITIPGSVNFDVKPYTKSIMSAATLLQSKSTTTLYDLFDTFLCLGAYKHLPHHQFLSQHQYNANYTGCFSQYQHNFSLYNAITGNNHLHPKLILPTHSVEHGKNAFFTSTSNAAFAPSAQYGSQLLTEHWFNSNKQPTYIPIMLHTLDPFTEHILYASTGLTLSFLWKMAGKFAWLRAQSAQHVMCMVGLLDLPTKQHEKAQLSSSSLSSTASTNPLLATLRAIYPHYTHLLLNTHQYITKSSIHSALRAILARTSSPLFIGHPLLVLPRPFQQYISTQFHQSMLALHNSKTGGITHANFNLSKFSVQYVPHLLQQYVQNATLYGITSPALPELTISAHPLTNIHQTTLDSQKVPFAPQTNTSEDFIHAMFTNYPVSRLHFYQQVLFANEANISSTSTNSSPHFDILSIKTPPTSMDAIPTQQQSPELHIQDEPEVLSKKLQFGLQVAFNH